MTHYAEDWERSQRLAQLELSTVINHSIDAPIIRTHQDTGIQPGVRLAKMLNKYDDHPSSELWREIQGLAREILK
ncbi:hypothetical protein D3C85_1087200 [compost metagenome]